MDTREAERRGTHNRRAHDLRMTMRVLRVQSETRLAYGMGPLPRPALGLFVARFVAWLHGMLD